MAPRLAVHDPGRVNLRKAIRAAVLLPLLLAIGVGVLDDAELGLFAAFASFAGLVLADFGGEPLPRRFREFVGFGALGAAFIAIGTLVSGDVVAATAAMAVIAFGVLLAGVVGGAVASGGGPVILSFVLAATVPAPAGEAGPRAAAWFVAALISGAVAVLAWPKRERVALRDDCATALRTLAAAIRAPEDASVEAATDAALDAVRARAAGVLYRSSGRAERDEAMVGIVGGLIQARPFVDRLPPLADVVPVETEERELRSNVADAFDAAADTLTGAPGGNHVDLVGIEHSRVAHRDALEAWAARELAGGTSSDEVLGVIDATFPVRVQSHLALSLGAEALLAVGGPVELDAIESSPVLADRATGRRAALHRQLHALVRSHLTLRSASCRTALRGAVGLAIAVLLATSLDLQHGFWVVLGTLSALRSSALGTGATALNALAGTIAGFAAAAVMILLTGDNEALLWILLPIVVFLAGYAPGAIHFVVGQAAFTVFVVVLFNIVIPEGFETAFVRVEDIAIGAAVGVTVGLLFWPRGARGAFLSCLALLYHRSATHLRLAFAQALGTPKADELNAARDDSVICRRRADDAYSQFASERGARELPVDTWAQVLTADAKLRLSADAVVFHGTRDYVRKGCDEGAAEIAHQSDAMAAGFDRMAERLGGTMTSRLAPRELAGMRSGVSACLREHAHGGPHEVSAALALVWMADWLHFLDEVLAALEEPSAHIAAIADRPWWR